MTQEWHARFGKIINYICCYGTVNLGRSVFFSFALLFLVMLLRRLSFFGNCFRRIVLWGAFLWLPFIGGLKFFYETRFGVRGFLWWANWNYEHCLTGQVYFAVMVLYGGYLFYKRRKLQRFAAGLKRLAGNVYVCEAMVTPFAMGLFSPRIVVPRALVEEYGEEDLETILFHEKMHIRLGHLWCLFLWDVLRVLLWPNIFLTFGARFLRAGLEEMCDLVTIQESGKDPCDYGLLLLKCVRLLWPAEKGKLIMGSAAFAGARGRSGYVDMKRRIRKIAAFRGNRVYYGTLHKSSAVVDIDVKQNPAAKAYYLCGLSEGFVWELNTHVAFVPDRNSEIHIENDRIKLDITNARRIHFWDYVPNPPGNFTKSQRTCRNWIFANYLKDGMPL